MASLPSILCVGRDPVLLGSRAKLLQSLDAEVKWTTSVLSALEQVRSENFDLVVLCHTLEQGQSQALSNAIRQRKPPPFILKLTRSFPLEAVERARFPCDAVVNAHPASLTECAKALLLRKSASSTFLPSVP